MALGSIGRRNRQFVVPKLHITAMMDMFTIILIFLLFSFSDNPETFQMDKDMNLPESTAKMDYKDSIKLVLSQTSLKLDGEVIAEIQDGKVIGLNPAELKKSSLYERLKAYRDQVVALNPNEDSESEKHILFLCDKRISFKTINNIVKTAGMAGYPNFQFAVLKKVTDS